MPRRLLTFSKTFPLILFVLGLFLGYLAGSFTSLRDESAQPSTGDARLYWIPPTANTDGSPLTDLAGYVIRCWNQRGELIKIQTVANPAATNYLVENLVPGVYHCGVSAINKDGVESALSNLVARIISDRSAN